MVWEFNPPGNPESVMSRSTLIVAFVCLLLGTNVLTWTTTRYVTTRNVLTRAQQRMETVLREEGVFEQLSIGEHRIEFRLAIPLAGGRYYGYNAALPYWGVGIVLLAAGVLIPFARNKRSAAKNDAKGS